MFKGKIYVYKNVNGKEEKVEKEFTNEKDFEEFAKSHLANFPSRTINWTPPIMGLRDWITLDEYFDKLLERKLGALYEEPIEELPEQVVDLDTYEQELKRIEAKKTNKEEYIKKHKATLEKLKEYRKKFKAEGREDMIKKIDEDIKKVEMEIKNLQK